jgi:hypothetical protein
MRGKRQSEKRLGSERTGCYTCAHKQHERMNYDDFIDGKRHKPSSHGIDPWYIPDGMFDYQRYVSEYAIRKGRCAVFLDTGLGKTLIELTTAVNFRKHTGKPVLILTPLAVAFQFIKEAEKFGITDIQYSKDGKHDAGIVVCNYERLDKFSADDFGAVILDESSILKNFDGAIKSQVTSFMKRVKYRFLFTATPSPNDFIELGTSSEALGYMGYMDMLGKFFTNNEDTISPQAIGTKWMLKGHAETAFFEWVSSWSVSMRKPSDLGFSDERHILPALNLVHHSVKNEENLVVDGQIQLFNQIARRLTEVRSEQKLTTTKRCERAVELVHGHDSSVYWCNFNGEGDLLEELDKDARQVKGSMNIERKEELLLAFSSGELKRLITKPKITAFGLNWQHCAHTVFFPTFSYEQYYQAIRRFWRFGQTRPVTVDLVYSDGQQRVMDSLIAKAEKAAELFDKLNASINADYHNSVKEFNKPVTLPSFLQQTQHA